jgi:hypothetical protein
VDGTGKRTQKRKRVESDASGDEELENGEFVAYFFESQQVLMPHDKPTASPEKPPSKRARRGTYPQKEPCKSWHF